MTFWASRRSVRLRRRAWAGQSRLLLRHLRRPRPLRHLQRWTIWMKKGMFPSTLAPICANRPLRLLASFNRFGQTLHRSCRAMAQNRLVPVEQLSERKSPACPSTLNTHSLPLSRPPQVAQKRWAKRQSCRVKTKGQRRCRRLIAHHRRCVCPKSKWWTRVSTLLPPCPHLLQPPQPPPHLSPSPRWTTAPESSISLGRGRAPGGSAPDTMQPLTRTLFSPLRARTLVMRKQRLPCGGQWTSLVFPWRALEL